VAFAGCDAARKCDAPHIHIIANTRTLATIGQMEVRPMRSNGRAVTLSVVLVTATVTTQETLRFEVASVRPNTGSDGRRCQ
jgi:hypothetical protein